MATASVPQRRIRIRRRRRSLDQEITYAHKLAAISEAVATLRYRLHHGQYADARECDQLMQQFERALRQRSKLMLDIR